MLRKSLIIHPSDNVAVILEDGHKGDTIHTPDGTVTLLEDIEFAHKILLCDAKQGDPIIKYGAQIGYLLRDEQRGAWISSHNLGCDRGK